MFLVARCITLPVTQVIFFRSSIMPTTGAYVRRATARDLHFFQNPHLWPHRPFLPLTRRETDNGLPQLGVLYDARGASGTYGHACTVFLTNLLSLPPTEAEFFALPKCVYDTFDELADDGWVVD
jgi:hypothetical protein